jgi:hypothetical protein
MSVLIFSCVMGTQKSGVFEVGMAKGQ